MSVIVTDAGFRTDDWSSGFAGPDDVPAGRGIDLGPDADPASLRDRLDAFPIIRVAFPHFADGRGFTIARRLRLMGYAGRLRAHGHVLADQYAMARRSGFDEVEIPDALTARQPEEQWRFRGDWRRHDHQARLRGKPAGISDAQSDHSTM